MQANNVRQNTFQFVSWRILFNSKELVRGLHGYTW